jgi:DNA-binding beta-propeller fold protein YncE
MASSFLVGVAACAIPVLAGISTACAAEPLTLEAKIELGDVSGRIDHLAIDLPRQRLFVAELGNDSVGVVDLKEGKLIRRIAGLKRPQGIAYHQPSDTLYVANAGDGSLRMFRGSDYSALDRVDLNDDADNVRIDLRANRIFVGYGNGALAVVDPESRKRIADIPLKAHPESFQLAPANPQIFVNVPEAHEIAVVDREARRQTASWKMVDANGNFPMAIDEASARVAVVFRNPARLRAYAIDTGKMIDEVEICGDADDVFIDAKRKRIYVSCGAGFIDVVDARDKYKRLARIPTVAGARTSLFVADLDRLFLAVRAASRERAGVWVYRPEQ